MRTPGEVLDPGKAVQVVLLMLLLAGPALVASAQTVTEFQIPTANATPSRIVAGPDGNIWFTENGANKIGRITTSGAITEFPIPTASSGPAGITNGPDGALWFTEQNGNQIGRITTAGAVTEFPVLTASAGPLEISSGSDGALWFTESGANKIGRITTSGAITEFPIPTPSSGPTGITTGPDGALWFTEQSGNKIGRITTAGVVTGEFPIPTPGAVAQCITAGPDGNLWSANRGLSQIARITTGGAITEFPASGMSGTLRLRMQCITAGPPSDGALWFTVTETGLGQIGRITTGGVVTVFPTVIQSRLDGITAGPDGALWFAERTAGKIGRITTGAAGGCVSASGALCLNNGRFKATVTWRVPSQGTSGVGTAVALTGDTGYFWFFSANNVELVLKVVDGRAFNGRFWVFYGALSDVEYTITITDTVTGATQIYFNPSGQLTSASDTAAFSGVTFEPSLAAAGPPSDPPVTDPVERLAESTAACTADSTTLCLNGGRFQVRVNWSVPTQGTSGPGMATPITGDTGHYWFFSSNNIELIVKVVDGRAFNNKFWVFSGALTNVAYTITVTDTQTGAVKTYSNPSGTQQSLADTGAF